MFHQHREEFDETLCFVWDIAALKRSDLRSYVSARHTTSLAYVFADAHLVTWENRVGKMLERTSLGKRFSV